MSRRLMILIPVFLLASSAVAQWSAPVLVANVNSTASDFGPSPSQDGLTLYFTSSRGGNGWNIWRATRSGPYAAFAAPVEVKEINSTANDSGPEVRGDELEIFLSSYRAGGTGSSDLWRATRPSTALTFSAPVPVVELNTSSTEWGPTITSDGLLIYFTSGRPGGQGSVDIWAASRRDVNSPFGPPVNVTEINTNVGERDAKISADGLTIFWSSTRIGGAGETDNWMASRLDRSSPFTNVVNLGAAANSSRADMAPGCWQFRDELFFCSDRAVRGVFHIWVSRFTGLTASGVAGPAKIMTLNFADPTSAGLAYAAAASFGSSPGIPLGNRTLPLNFDDLLKASVGGLPPFLRGYAGVLDADGVAIGFITFPASPVFVGIDFFNAFVVIDPTAPLSIKTISNALEVLTQ